MRRHDMHDDNGRWNLTVTILSWAVMAVGSGVGLYFAFSKAVDGAIIAFLFTISLETALFKYDSYRLSQRFRDLAALSCHLSSMLKTDSSGKLVIPTCLRYKVEGIPSVQEQAKDAKHIWALFVTGKDLVEDWGAVLTRKCEEGCELHIVTAQEGSKALEAWGKHNQVTDADAQVRTTTDCFQKLRKPNGPDIVKCLEEFIPSFTLFATDPDGPDGEIVVGFQTFRGYSGSRPYIHLKASERSPWYDSFKAQFVDMWDQSRPSAPAKHSDLGNLMPEPEAE